MKWIGLTGGIATGKSTVKKLIEGLGFPVIDADQIAHELTGIGASGYVKIQNQFGQKVLNSDLTLNRKALGQIVFNYLAQRNILENLLHPLIQAEVQNRKNILTAQGQKICFYDVPLLFEKNLQNQFDLIILVWCDLKLQKHRLRSRNHLSGEDVDSRLAAQIQMGYKIKKSHYCLDNTSDLSSLEKQVKHLLQTIV